MPADAGDFSLELVASTLRVERGTTPRARARLTNTSSTRWQSSGSPWVAGNICDATTGEPLPSERRATTLAARVFNIEPGASVEMSVLIFTRDADQLAAGEYLLRIAHRELGLRAEAPLMVVEAPT